MMRATPESPRMFESEFVDFFSRTHPAVVPVVYVPASAALFWYGVSGAGLTIALAGLLFLAGLTLWTLSEYWLHRTFFHWMPKFPGGDRLHFLVHGVHHKWPKDKYRLVMPPAVSIALFFLFLGLWYLLFGPRLVWPIHAGFVFGYMVYDMTHYYVHHFSPRSEYGRELKKHHMLHHFKDPTRRFGVSSTVWDRVFGTKG
jgi:sterol desaturase/sphingolipid hydroxylase (fatty acid hydroxylase superfamily)